MGKKVERSTRPPGRPRAFDPELALERALRLFWEKGYEGTSLSDLTEAIGINRPSLYAAFGDKESLFLKALDRYSEGRAADLKDALAQPTARAVVERFLGKVAEVLGDSGNPRGCLLVHGALSCGAGADPIRRELILRRKDIEVELRRRFKRAKSDGDLPAEASPSDLASYVATVAHGMAVQAAGGASRSELQRIVQLVVRAWPKS